MSSLYDCETGWTSASDIRSEEGSAALDRDLQEKMVVTREARGNILC